MSERWVCSASHGQPPGSRSRLARRSRRDTSAAAVTPPVSTNSDVRWSGSTTRSSSSSGTAVTRFVGKAEALEHGDGRGGVEMLEQGQLHVGEHEAGVALRDEQRARELGVLDVAAVDDPRLRVHRIDSHPCPREIGERQAGNHFQHERAARRGLVEQRDGALGDHRIAGNRVRDLTVGRGGIDQRDDHLLVGGVEIGRRVVDVIEGLEGGALGFELRDRGMTACAHVAHREPFERGAGRGKQVVDARRSEPHDDDPTSHPRHANRLGVNRYRRWESPGYSRSVGTPHRSGATCRSGRRASRARSVAREHRRPALPAGSPTHGPMR